MKLPSAAAASTGDRVQTIAQCTLKGTPWHFKVKSEYFSDFRSLIVSQSNIILEFSSTNPSIEEVRSDIVLLGVCSVVGPKKVTRYVLSNKALHAQSPVFMLDMEPCGGL